MTEHTEHPQRRICEFGPGYGFTLRYRALHEVHVTNDLGPERSEDLMAFIKKHFTVKARKYER